MFRNLLNYIDLSYLNPLIEFLNDWYITIILLLVTAGIIYAIILGIKLAKSDSPDERLRSKKRIANASLTIVIIIALTFILQFVLTNLNGWVNGGGKSWLDSQAYVKNVTYTLDNGGMWGQTGTAQFTKEGQQGNEVGVYSIIVSDEATRCKFVFELAESRYSINGGNEKTINLNGDSGEFVIDVYAEYESGVVGGQIDDRKTYTGSYKIVWTRASGVLPQ